MHKGRTLKRLGLSLAITAGFIALLVIAVPPGEISQRFVGITIHWAFFPAFLAAVFGNVYLRGATLALIVNANPPVGGSRWLAIASAHNLGTSLSGMVFGDAFLFWLMYRFGIHWKKSIFTTLLTRIFELPPLLLVFFIGVLCVPDLFPGQHIAAPLLGLAFAASLAVLFTLDQLLGLLPERFLFGQVEAVAGFRAAYRELTGRCMASLVALSFAKIFLSLLYFVFALALFAQDLPFLQVCLLFGVFNFASAIPLQGLAGLGTFEAYFGAGLVLMGWTVASAVALAFQVHMLFLACFVLMSLLAVLPLVLSGALSVKAPVDGNQ